MITKKLFKILLVVNVFSFVSGTKSMDQQEVDMLRRRQTELEQELLPVNLLSTEGDIVAALRTANSNLINLLDIPFHRKLNFTGNFGEALRRYSNLHWLKVGFDRASNSALVTTFLTGIALGSLYFKQIENLCQGRFKAITAVISGATCVGYGIYRFSQWITDKIVKKETAYAKNQLEGNINMLKQNMLPETAQYLRLQMIENRDFSRQRVGLSLLNRPFANDNEIHGACRVLQEIQTRDS